MKLFSMSPTVLILLVLFATPALGTFEDQAHLPDCAAPLTGLSICGSGPSYTNDIFRCNGFTWSLMHTCTSPNAPCSNGTCSPLPTPCIDATLQCATLRSHGYQGVLVCRSGKWDLRGECDCSDDQREPQCITPQMSSVEANVLAKACRRGQLVCMAADSHGKDGAVFRCNEQGRWRVVQDCRSYERCVERPVPHCTWA